MDDRIKHFAQILELIAIVEAHLQDQPVQDKRWGIYSSSIVLEDTISVADALVILDTQFVRGMKRVAFTLYRELVADGHHELVRNLLAEDDVRRVDYGLVSAGTSPDSGSISTSQYAQGNRQFQDR